MISVLEKFTSLILNNEPSLALGIESVEWKLGLPVPGDWAECTVRITNHSKNVFRHVRIQVVGSEFCKVGLMPASLRGSSFSSQIELPLIGLNAFGSNLLTFFTIAVSPTIGTQTLFSINLYENNQILDIEKMPATPSSIDSWSDIIYPS